MTYAAGTDADFAARYRAGATLREIAEAAGVSVRYVQRALHAAGVVMRPPVPRVGVPRKGTEWRAKVLPLVAEGMTTAAIAERLGVSHSAVSRVRRRAGAPA